MKNKKDIISSQKKTNNEFQIKFEFSEIKATNLKIGGTIVLTCSTTKSAIQLPLDYSQAKSLGHWLIKQAKEKEE